MIKIDLSYNIANKLINSPIKSTSHFPFNRFSIICPVGIYLDVKFLREKVRMNLPNDATFIDENIIVNEIKNEKMLISVKVKGSKIHVKVGGADFNILKMVVAKKRREIINTNFNNNFFDGLSISLQKKYRDTTKKIIFSVVQFLNNSPDKINTQINKYKAYKVKKKEVDNKSTMHQSRLKQKDNVIYLNKDNYYRVKAKSEKRNTYNRYKDNWLVRGHYRKYRDDDGNVIKKVWIKPHIRGDKSKVEDIRDDRTYKIS
ncbi:MAG: hypothetical protein ACOCRK_01495 [bacterium]